MWMESLYLHSEIHEKQRKKYMQAAKEAPLKMLEKKILNKNKKGMAAAKNTNPGWVE